MKPIIEIAHLQITDHLVLGVCKHWLDSGEIDFKEFSLKTTSVVEWNDVKNLLQKNQVNGAFILSPFAMDIFRTQRDIQLVLFGHRNGSILVKNKKAGINSISDFKGKEVIIPHQLSIHNMLFHQLLAEKGYNADPGGDVLLEVIAPSEIPEMIRKYPSLAGFIVAEPFGSQVITEGLGEELMLSKDIWPGHPCCVFVVKQRLIDDHANALQELIGALVKAGKFIESNPVEAAKIGAKFLNQREDVVYKVLTQPMDRITTNNLFPVIEDLEKIQKYMTDKMSKGMFGQINLEKFVNHQFALNAGAT
ncbi:MAG: ABC transporter substrate-binding protein [Leptospiraceae bacterium]|nr:ABC transporter substrate-binding protein [Leptospiraceae bacterium]MCP5494730.1 ABC transporter substrate-binding protein [Leptospiraceae bacterium]